VGAEESCAFSSDFELRPDLRFGVRDEWQDEQNEIGDCGMRIACVAFSVIRKRG